MAKIEIDGNFIEVSEKKNVLEICLSLGMDLPYFCWHPALGPVGACRQCAVKQFKNTTDTQGKIVMACMTHATEGARFSVHDREASDFRKSIIEWLMLNHPHDCPICDEGGECHLQDMTWMTGHTTRRFRFKKRTFKNQNLGPFVHHEMNRCIACYRCVRFYRDYAGGRDLNVFSSRDRVYFGRYESGKLESEFSGNLVEICPTGVFTDQLLSKNFVRKWDLQTAPSLCPHCSVGCNTLPGERSGTIRRIRNRYHEEINGYFLCDRGRYGYEFNNSDQRLSEIQIRRKRTSSLETLSSTQGLEYLSQLLRSNPSQAKTIGIGSPRATIEANFALKTLVGSDHFFSGLSDLDDELLSTTIACLKESPAASASISDIEKSDVILILGEDLIQTAPRIALAVRQTPCVLLATAHFTALNTAASQSFMAAPDDITRLAYAIAHHIDESYPSVPELSVNAILTAERMSQILLQAKRPSIITGIGLRSRSLLEAAAHLVKALHSRNPSVKIAFAGSHANDLGLGLLQGKPLSLAFHQVKSRQVETLIVLENDLYRRDIPARVRTLLALAERVILVEALPTAMVPHADVILPCATSTESNGTWVNYEGRAQRFYSVSRPPSPSIRESWEWMRDLIRLTGRKDADSWHTPEDLLKILRDSDPHFKWILENSISPSFRISSNKIARQSQRMSGRTAILADRTLHEPKPPEDSITPFSFSMEGFHGVPPAPLVPRYRVPGWNSVQALTFYQTEAGGPAKGGPSGQKLIRPSLIQAIRKPIKIPDAFQAQPGQWLAIPTYSFFGAEELSQFSPTIAALTPDPVVTVHPRDVDARGFKEGDIVDLWIEKTHILSLPIRCDASLVPGTLGVPIGLPSLGGNEMHLFTCSSSWCEVRPHLRTKAAS